jgi:hypothetical protein
MDYIKNLSFFQESFLPSFFSKKLAAGGTPTHSKKGGNDHAKKTEAEEHAERRRARRAIRGRASRKARAKADGRSV